MLARRGALSSEIPDIPTDAERGASPKHAITAGPDLIKLILTACIVCGPQATELAAWDERGRK
jgi:hypothetical protein